MKQFAYPDWKTIKKILSIALLLLYHFHPNTQVLEGVPVTDTQVSSSIMQIRHVFYEENVCV